MKTPTGNHEQVPAGLGGKVQSLDPCLRSTHAVFQEQGIVYKSEAENVEATTLSRDVSYEIFKVSVRRLASACLWNSRDQETQAMPPLRQLNYRVKVELLVADEQGQGMDIPN